MTPDWAPHTHQQRPWRQRTIRGARADKQVREITVSLPPYIAERELAMDRELAAMTPAAVGDLSNLDLVHGRTLKALNHLHLRAESVDSSKIEDIDASLADYGRALLGVGANASANSMASATSALTRLIGDTQRTHEVRSAAVLQAHHDLFARVPDEAHRAGVYRTTQNWVGGSDYSPLGALHVPPPPETVPAYLDDLFAFSNRDDLPPLVQGAIAHAQFESIHPFIDGNGRIGRTLIHAILRRRRATRHLTVPIASALVADRDRYFAALDDYRAGTARTLIEMLASATRITTAESWRSVEDLDRIRDSWAAASGNPAPGTPDYRMLDLLVEEPIVNVALATRRLRIDEDDVAAAIPRLVAAGVLTQAPRSRRQPLWLAHDVLDEVEDLSQRIRARARRPAPEHRDEPA